MSTTTTTTININTRVRNYQGNNSFLLKMKEAITKYGSLTVKQAEAAEKCLATPETKIDMNNLPENIEKIVKYEGTNTFVLDIKEKFTKYGTLTDKQVSAANKQIQSEIDKANIIKMTIPTPGQTVKLGRKIGQQIKEKYGLEFNPIVVDITKVIGMSPKAVHLSAKMTVKRGKVCQVCCKTLTDEFSMLTGVGKICAGHMKIPYITDLSQADKFREDYLKKVEEIGEFQFWVPNTQIKEWSKPYMRDVIDNLFS